MKEPNEIEEGFWAFVTASVNPALQRPEKCVDAYVVRLEGRTEPYYVLKHPEEKTYLRLSEADYALYWQMDGRKTIKDLLYYNFMRYGSLPFGRLTTLVENLRQGHFLAEKPTMLYEQVAARLKERAPATRGRRILNSFLYTEWSCTGLDPFFKTIYSVVRPLFLWPVQLLLLLFILFGGALYTRLFLNHTYTLIGGNELLLRVITLFMANLVVIGLHELAHGVTVKHFGRELDRGGFLLYWGFPAFFVDTKDMWLSPRKERVLVSWAGPHSGLIIGAGCGLLLTFLSQLWPEYTASLWASFLYQIGFIAFLSVFVNLNPLLELDGYFIMMDWLEMPGLRQRAFAFLRHELLSKIRGAKEPARLFESFNATERIFTLFGLAALIYSTYALGFALYFWQTRIQPPITDLWFNYGFGGRLLILAITLLVVVPALYYVGLYFWSHIRDGLEWLARRNLLAQPSVLASIIGLPLATAVVIVQVIGGVTLELTTLFIHLAAVAALASVAHQLRGSRFQWSIWSMVASLVFMTLAFLNHNPAFEFLFWIGATASLLLASLLAWTRVWPLKFSNLQNEDRLLMALGLLLNTGSILLLSRLITGRFIPVETSSSLFVLSTTVTLLAFAPMMVNFWQSRFALPWLLIGWIILSLPWVVQFPGLQLPTMTLWLYTALIYLALGALAQFGRHTIDPKPATSERTRLVNGFSHFLQAMFAAYEAVFGDRRLSAIQKELKGFGFLDANSSVLEIAEYCRKAVLLVVDRLDDLAGTPFTAQAGQAAYDSLPWPEAETMARYVLSQTDWGGELAEQSIRHHNHLAVLIRRADIFGGFDQAGLQRLLDIGRPWRGRPGTVMAQAGAEAERFFLIESGEVAVLSSQNEGGHLKSGGYFGTNALVDSGPYNATYQALTEVKAYVIERQHFDPLLRADTLLASQVIAGKAERNLLEQMPIFTGLSPQQLATIDARLVSSHVPAGSTIVKQGQSRSHLFIVFTGQIEARYGDEEGSSDQTAVEYLGQGEHFGEYALFADTPYQATYRAVVDSHLLLLDEPTFDQLVFECSEMSHYVEQIGSGRLINTRRRLQLSSMVG